MDYCQHQDHNTSSIQQICDYFIIESVFSLGMILLIYTQLTNIFMGQTTFERFAIQNNTSTLNSIMRPSNQNSLLDDQGSTTKQRLTKTSCKNFLTFATQKLSTVPLKITKLDNFMEELNEIFIVTTQSFYQIIKRSSTITSKQQYRTAL